MQKVENIVIQVKAKVINNRFFDFHKSFKINDLQNHVLHSLCV
jgi:hypothetical protein